MRSRVDALSSAAYEDLPACPQAGANAAATATAHMIRVTARLRTPPTCAGRWTRRVRIYNTLCSRYDRCNLQLQLGGSRIQIRPSLVTQRLTCAGETRTAIGRESICAPGMHPRYGDDGLHLLPYCPVLSFRFGSSANLGDGGFDSCSTDVGDGEEEDHLLPYAYRMYLEGPGETLTFFPSIQPLAGALIRVKVIKLRRCEIRVNPWVEMGLIG